MLVKGLKLLLQQVWMTKGQLSLLFEEVQLQLLLEQLLDAGQPIHLAPFFLAFTI